MYGNYESRNKVVGLYTDTDVPNHWHSIQSTYKNVAKLSILQIIIREKILQIPPWESRREDKSNLTSLIC